MKLKTFGLWALVALMGLMVLSPVLAATFEPQPDPTTVSAVVPYVPVPSPSQGFNQDVLLTIVGLLLPWLVIIIRWVLALFKWELSGNNTKMLVAILSGILTIVVMIVYHAFGDIHGFWAYLVAIVSRLGLVIGMAEVAYGQIISRITPLNNKLSKVVKVK
jgi:magnesium-transporting ATPase (P-type)